MKVGNALLLILIGCHILDGHDVITTKLTFTRDIRPILFRRCLGCHSSNDSVPLSTYEEARPWAVSIKQQVLSRKMPPWGAVKGFGDLSPDEGLTEEEMTLITAWVVGGAPEGISNGSRAPIPPKPEQLRPLHNPGLAVATQLRLAKRFSLAALRPEGKFPVKSARIIAVLPEGRTVPLVWLFGYDPQWKRTFRLRQPLELPAGTSVQSNSPLDFTLFSLQ